MLPESTIFNFNFENIIFMALGLPDFGEGKWKNIDKTGKVLNFPGP